MSAAAVKIAGFVGSLREKSYNRMLYSAFAEALPENVQLGDVDYRHLPPFDADDMANGLPDAVVELAAQVSNADAIVIVSPEYNYSVPGTLKNAIDWISRSPDKPFAGKPVLMMSASTSLLGGARMQYHLRQILVFLDAHPINKPELFLSSAASRFDDAGKLTDEMAKTLISDAIEALLNWQEKIAGV